MITSVFFLYFVFFFNYVFFFLSLFILLLLFIFLQEVRFEFPGGNGTACVKGVIIIFVLFDVCKII